MARYLVYNLSGELDDISYLFPNERLGRLAALAGVEGVAVDVLDRANLKDLLAFGPGFMKNLGELGFADSNEQHAAGVREEAERILDSGCTALFLNLWHGTGFKFSVDLACELRRRRRDLAIYGVGQKIDWYKEHILRLTGDSIDGLITGLGYNAARHLLRGGAAADCPDFITQQDGRIRINRRETLNVDDYPAATYDPAVYRQIAAKVPLYTITLSNQACPNRCVFCVRPENYGRVNVRRDLRSVVAELRHLRFERGVRHFRIEDSTPPPQAMTELARGILASDLAGQISLSGFARVDSNSREDFGLLRAAGFRALFFGIESLDDENLRRIRKGTSYRAIHDTLRAAHEAGVATVGSFIFPLPRETRATMDNTLRRLDEIRPWLDSLLAFPACVYPPTDWGRNPARYGIRLDADYIEKFVVYPLKYLLPLKYWPPAPFRYSVMGCDLETMDFKRDVFGVYDEFTAHVKELGIPFIPDYYYLLAEIMGQDPVAATRQLVQAMIARDYAAIRQALLPG